MVVDFHSCLANDFQFDQHVIETGSSSHSNFRVISLICDRTSKEGSLDVLPSCLPPRTGRWGVAFFSFFHDRDDWVTVKQTRE